MRQAALCLYLLLAACQQAHPASSHRDRPSLALLTSLPILFGETLTLDMPANPLLEALEQKYRVNAVDGPERLPARGLLLAIQPQAMTAQRLVALDAWVRQGGRLVLLADPRLSWESQRPLGDTLRPPFSYPDTGLLQHWGLRLLPPPAGAGEMKVEVGGQTVTMETAGALAVQNPTCRLLSGSLAVSCAIGKGQVTVVADADWAMADTPGSGLTGHPENRSALIGLIELVED